MIFTETLKESSGFRVVVTFVRLFSTSLASELVKTVKRFMKGALSIMALFPLAGPAAAQVDLTGSWLGTLATGAGELRIVFNLEREGEGYTATMDSPDQGATGIATSGVEIDEDSIRIEVSVAAGEFVGRIEADGTRIRGEWRQGGLNLPLELERGEVEPPSRPQHPEPPFPYRSEDVRYPNTEVGIELAGTLTIPEGSGPFPAVVLISGSGPQDRDERIFDHRPFLVLADHLTNRGVAVLRFDDRGVGESEGTFGTATSEDFASDVKAALSYLRSRPEIRPDGMGLMGHSEGGLIAPMVAAEGDEVAFLVMLAGPGVTGEEILYLQSELLLSAADSVPTETIAANRRLQEALFGIVKEHSVSEALPLLEAALRDQLPPGVTGAAVDPFVRGQVAQVNSPWFRFFLTYDPAPALRRVSVPVLALNGSLDLQVPPDQNLPAIRSALEEGGNADITTIELEGLNHLFQPATTGAVSEYVEIETTFDPGALDRISEWVLRVTGGE